jgi:hypothetical protein
MDWWQIYLLRYQNWKQRSKRAVVQPIKKALRGLFYRRLNVFLQDALNRYSVGLGYFIS